MLAGMNYGHNKMALWCIDECIRPSDEEDILDIGCGGGQKDERKSMRSGLLGAERGKVRCQEQESCPRRPGGNHEGLGLIPSL